MPKGKPRLSKPLAGNVDLIVQIEENALAQRSRTERIADRVVQMVGSVRFLALQLGFVALWIGLDLAGPSRHFDPFPFGLLNLMLAGEGVLLTSFVLAKQKYMSRRADHREHLALQVSLLTEKEVTTALQLLSRISERLGLDPEHADPEIAELRTSTAVDALAEHLQNKLPGL